MRAGSARWRACRSGLAGAQDKLAQLDVEAARRSNGVSLGMPAFGQIGLGSREMKGPLQPLTRPRPVVQRWFLASLGAPADTQDGQITA